MKDIAFAGPELDCGISELCIEEIRAVNGGARVKAGIIFGGWLGGKVLDYVWGNFGRPAWDMFTDSQTTRAHWYGDVLMENRRSRGVI